MHDAALPMPKHGFEQAMTEANRDQPANTAIVLRAGLCGISAHYVVRANTQ
jgi:hypothetical protein